MDDGRISRVLYPAGEQQRVQYRVMVATSDVRGAGTDARLRLMLHGAGGDGADHALAPGARGFERCACDGCPGGLRLLSLQALSHRAALPCTPRSPAR